MPWLYFIVIVIVSHLIGYIECDGYGFAYSHFTGPVSGPIEEVVVPVYGDDPGQDPNSPPVPLGNKVVDFVVSIRMKNHTNEK